jgi:c-di-GMP-binding flagellar brake protein YcgR
LLSNPDTSIERRRCSRVLLGCPVMVTSSLGIMMGQIIDISLGGAFICCKKPLSLKEILELQFRISPASPTLTLRGEVVRTDVHCLANEIRCHGMGVQFNEISPDNRRVIQGFVDRGVEV